MEQEIFDLKEGGLVFLSIDHKNNEKKAKVFVNWRAEPLDIDSLESFLDDSKNKTLDINLNITESFLWKNNRRVPINNEYKYPFNLDCDIENRADIFCIVPGGWLPIGVGIINSTVLGDRNFIDRIKNYFSNDEIKEIYKGNFLSDKLEEMRLKIDILPFVLEGNQKKLQNISQISQQFEEAKFKVKNYLPNIPIVEYENIHLDEYVNKILTYLKPTIELRQEFLGKVQPLLLNPSPKVDRIVGRWDKIIEVADEVGISRNDILVICCLLVISSPQNDSPIRDLLKPHSSEEIYNAIFDINLIELLLNKTKKYPEANYVVVTHDKNLVRLASIMANLDHQKSDGTTSTFKSSIPIKYIGTDERLHNKLNEILNLDK